jgi:hypothetical protein
MEKDMPDFACKLPCALRTGSSVCPANGFLAAACPLGRTHGSKRLEMRWIRSNCCRIRLPHAVKEATWADTDRTRPPCSDTAPHEIYRRILTRYRVPSHQLLPISSPLPIQKTISKFSPSRTMGWRALALVFLCLPAHCLR